MPPFKRPSDTKLQRKREKGPCYNCDKKYGPGHRCRNKELQVHVVQEDDDAEEQEEIMEGE